MLKKKFYFKFVSTILLLVLAVSMYIYEAWIDSKQIVDATVITVAQWDSYKEHLEAKPFSPESVRWCEEPVPYDFNTNRIFLPQSLKNVNWEGNLSATSDGVKLFFLESDGFSSKRQSIYDNEGFWLAVSDGKTWMETEVVFTGMPVVCMWGTADDQISSFLLIDAEKSSGRETAVSTNCKFHVRGGSSRGYAQDKSYRVSLCDQNGEKKNKNLLSIRDDDDWILNGLYADSQLVREKMAYWLWEAVNKLEENPVKSSSLTYVELFLNNEYKGVYGLMPRADSKLLGVTEADVVYRTRDWNIPVAADFSASIGENELKSGSVITIEHPKADGTWVPMQALCEYQRGKPDLLDQIGVLDEHNCVTYNLFTCFTQAEDNVWKNAIIVADRQENGDYNIYRSVWDLDLSFGNTWRGVLDSEHMENTRTTPYPWGTLIDIVYERLATENPDKMHELSRQKWCSWKRAGITADALCNYVDTQLEYLLASGALMRTSQHRANVPYLTDYTQLKGWIRQQFDQIDAYYEVG